MICPGKSATLIVERRDGCLGVFVENAVVSGGRTSINSFVDYFCWYRNAEGVHFFYFLWIF